MNWNQYFILKEKRRKWIIWLFILITAFHLYQIRDIISNNEFCSFLNETCISPNISSHIMLNQINISESNSSDSINKTMSLNSTNNTLGLFNNISLNKTKEKFTLKKAYSDSIIFLRENTKKETLANDGVSMRLFFWPDCNLCKADTYQDKLTIIKERFIYTPSCILFDLVLAFILANLLYFYKSWKFDSKPKEEKKEEKKEGS